MKPHPRRDGGFTLMEALVTLVVVSLVSGLLWQALAQAARVERMLDAGGLEAQGDALRLVWARRTLESLVPIGETEAHRFVGSASKLSGLASEVPGWPTSPAAAFELELVHDADSRRGELVLRLEGDRDNPPRLAITLARWVGEPGSMQYLGPEGRWSDRWPQDSVSGTPRVLPLAIAVSTGAEPALNLVAAPRSTGVPVISRTVLEQQ
jgi:prepilin-type N-terminal cleavage/methylation domain-containing protein